MLKKLISSVSFVLFSATLATVYAEEIEIFIPNISEDQSGDLVSSSTLARCLNTAKIEYCSGLSLSGDGSVYESFAEQEITLETLIIEDTNDIAKPTLVKTNTTPSKITEPVKPAPNSDPIENKDNFASVGIEIMFDYDSVKIRSDQNPKLNQVASALSEPINAEISFALIGHTDAKGSDAYNCKLSKGRASSVVASLILAGATSELYAVGAGEFLLRDAKNPDSERNRRVTIVKLEKNAEQLLSAMTNLCG